MKKDNIDVQIDEDIIRYIDKRIEKNNIDFISKINDIVLKILEEEKIQVDRVSVCISKETKEGIRKINKEYRNIDKSTDVLSFPIFEKKELELIANEKDDNKKIKELELGDIILCMDVVEEHSKEYETGLVRETLYMITHGVCHLVGYDHIEENDKILMRKLEEKVLTSIGVGK